MKAGEIKPCSLCGKGVMHTGLPLFYRIKVERMGIDMREVQKLSGMEKFMDGQVALARVFYDPDIAQPLSDAAQSLICEKCAVEPQYLAFLLEAGEVPA